MQMVAPAGPMYQAGTLSGNPLAMAAGLATLELVAYEGYFERLVNTTERVAQGFVAVAEQAGVPAQGKQVGSMMSLFFTQEPITDYASVKTSDTALFARFFNGLLAAGVYLAPSQFEAGFTSLAHDNEAIEHTLAAVEQVMMGL
jgi:glutamate-1-semialdehyde 2,1-aminomutase